MSLLSFYPSINLPLLLASSALSGLYEGSTELPAPHISQCMLPALHLSGITFVGVTSWHQFEVVESNCRASGLWMPFSLKITARTFKRV
jgi:hypothetical protein